MCQFLGKFLFFFQNSASKTHIFFPKLFQNPPVKWDHSKYCILNHQAEHAGTLPGGEQQQEPEPLWVLSRTFLILFTSHCTAQVLSCGESRYSLSSKATLCRVSCFFTKYNMAKKKPDSFTSCHSSHMVHTSNGVSVKTLLASFLFHLSCPAYLPFLSLGKTA